MSLHKKLIEKYKQYDIVFDDMNYLSIIHNSNILIRGKYLILGSYSLTKNIWIWADSSPTLDKNSIENIREFKNNIILKNINKNLRNFIESKPSLLKSHEMISILPRSQMFDMIDEIGRVADVGNNIISYKLSNNKIVFIIVEKIIFENLY
jgi:hypothetical protein